MPHDTTTIQLGVEQKQSPHQQLTNQKEINKIDQNERDGHQAPLSNHEKYEQRQNQSQAQHQQQGEQQHTELTKQQKSVLKRSLSGQKVNSRDLSNQHQSDRAEQNTAQQKTEQPVKQHHSQSNTQSKSQQMSEHREPKQKVPSNKIEPYQSINNNNNIPSKHTQEHQKSFSLGQVLAYMKELGHEIDEKRGQQIITINGNKDSITLEQINKFIKSQYDLQHLVDLKTEVWSIFNGYRNKFSSLSLNFNGIKNQTVSKHCVNLKAKYNEEPHTMLALQMRMGRNLNPHNVFVLYVQMPKSSKEEVLRQSIAQLKSKQDVAGQLLRSLDVSVRNQTNILKLRFQSSVSSIFVLDTIKELNSYIDSLGEHFQLNASIQLNARNKLSTGLSTNLPLIKWLLQGFDLNVNVEGSNEWVSNFVKYLVHAYKDKDNKLSAYLYLFKNSNINIEFKSPNDVDEFLNKLGILGIISGTTTLTSCLRSHQNKNKQTTILISELLNIITSVIDEQLAFDFSLPFLSIRIRMKADALSKALHLLI